MCKYNEDRKDHINEAIQNIAEKKARQLEAFIEQNIWFYKHLPNFLLKRLVKLEIYEPSCQFTTSKRYVLEVNKIFWVDITVAVF